MTTTRKPLISFRGLCLIIGLLASILVWVLIGRIASGLL